MVEIIAFLVLGQNWALFKGLQEIIKGTTYDSEKNKYFFSG